MQTISIRLSEETLKEIELLTRELGIQRSDLLREVLRKGLDEVKKELILEKLRKHEISFRKAAEFLGISYLELLEIMKREKLDIGMEIEDLEEDLAWLS